MRENGSVLGLFTKTNDPFFIEIVGKAGFDFVILDCEHGPNSPREVLPLLLAAKAGGAEPIVRVSTSSAIDLQRILDLDVAGVQVPQVNNLADAKAVVCFTKFHPLGMRGVCRNVRGADYSLKAKALFFAEQNEKLLVVHIEGVEGFNNLPDLLKVEGIDVYFIGPNDLSQSMGHPGEVDHPQVQGAIASIVAQCAAKGKSVGIYADTPEEVKRYRKMGVNYIAMSVDVAMFARALRDAVAECKS